MNEKINVNKLPNELIFVGYFWGFVLLRPILQYYNNISTLILLVYTTVLILVSLINNMFRRRTISVTSYKIILVVFIIMVYDYIFRPNEYVSKYMYEMLIYGVVPIYLITNINNIKELLRYYVWVSLIVFILYFYDPMNGYRIFGDYMTYGLGLTLPAFYGLYLGRRVFKKKWLMPIELLCFIMIILFSNRGAILSSVFFIIIFELLIVKNNSEKVALILITAFLVVFIVFNMEEILNGIIVVLNKNGIPSSTLYRLKLLYTSDNINEVSSGRLYIWSYAKEMINNNLLFGSGTGSFEAKYQTYSHNIFYDILVQYGLGGIVLFMYVIYRAIKKIYDSEYYGKILGILLFSLWFPKLLFSIYFFKDIGFWCFVAYGFLDFGLFCQSEKAKL